MDQVLKQYFRFSGELIHLKKFFPNSLFCLSFIHFDSLKLNPAIPVFEKPADSFSVGFFFASCQPK